MKITRKDIQNVVDDCFGPTKIRSITPFKGSHINTLWDIKLDKGKDIILRVFNEAWKAKKESFVYKTISTHTDIPIPRIYTADDSLEIIPFAYTLMSHIPGIKLEKCYRSCKNEDIYHKAGELLAKLHSIKFKKFGWIIGKDINPAFDRWKDFAEYDIELKLAKIKHYHEVKRLLPRVMSSINEQEHLFQIRSKPCMVHKDFHSSHIMADKDKIAGIIDVEWAIAGHNENDFTKMELWDFTKHPKMRKVFFDGYTKHGSISKDYTERKELYELWHRISMINISHELKNKEWLRHNLIRLKKFLN
ncbi:aminoglycoside phosphotransferase family protein [Candidatus Woesearchaeota archaeon]|nr:aminoglycoside phosphotransferase family protein [Candidatus Woesearchaeota archaeon]